jgi:hypothetical protein
MTEGNQPGGGHLNREDEPIRLKRDSDLSPEPTHTAHTSRQEWHRHGNEPTAYIPQDDEKPLPPQKPPTILDVFRFPFSLSGIIHFLIFWLGPFLLAFFARFLGLFFYGQFAIYGANTVICSFTFQVALSPQQKTNASLLILLSRTLLISWTCLVVYF